MHRGENESCRHATRLRACIVLLGMSWLSIACRADELLNSSDKVLLIAHRGGVVDQQRIENSLPAVQEAIRRGYFMLEVDIRESKDGRPVVHHDPDFVKYYDDPRHLADLTWSEIQRLRSTPGNLRPIDFSEYARACRGKIRLMLDIKEPDHGTEFFQQVLNSLRENGLLETAFAIGTDQAKKFLFGHCKIAVNSQELDRAIERGEDVGKHYFLFEHGDMLTATVKQAQQHGVAVVPSINVFHYPTTDHLRLAARDIGRLKRLGITYFQIDSVYEDLCWDQSIANEAARFPAAEAFQAVAVDSNHFFAIGNRRIGKYQKQTGKSVKQWTASDAIPLQHLNSGVVIGRKLYCAHSNYPQRPASSSVEIWDVDTLEHIGSHSFGIYEGSLTWVDRHDDSWWAVFAHYSRDASDDRAKDNAWTSLVKFDDHWRRLAAWTFPNEVLQRFATNSCSGGSWRLDGVLYCTGHDLREIYRLELPKSGSTLKLIDVIPCPITGQGICWDPQSERTLYGIDRPRREVVVIEFDHP